MNGKSAKENAQRNPRSEDSFVSITSEKRSRMFGSRSEGWIRVAMGMTAHGCCALRNPRGVRRRSINSRRGNNEKQFNAPPRRLFHIFPPITSLRLLAPRKVRPCAFTLGWSECRIKNTRKNCGIISWKLSVVWIAAWVTDHTRTEAIILYAEISKTPRERSQVATKEVNRSSQVEVK